MKSKIKKVPKQFIKVTSPCITVNVDFQTANNINLKVREVILERSKIEQINKFEHIVPTQTVNDFVICSPSAFFYPVTL